MYVTGSSQTEREELTGLLSGGKHAARKLKRAPILLAAGLRWFSAGRRRKLLSASPWLAEAFV
jgi:hypothetical protein